MVTFPLTFDATCVS